VPPVPWEEGEDFTPADWDESGRVIETDLGPSPKLAFICPATPDKDVFEAFPALSLTPSPILPLFIELALPLFDPALPP
jgi:hypothetical protein